MRKTKEKKDWREKLEWKLSHMFSIQEIEDFMQQELDKAYDRGIEDGMKGRVFKKVHITEKAHIPRELLDKAREEVLYEIKDEIFFGEVAKNLGERISKNRIENIIDEKLSNLKQ